MVVKSKGNGTPKISGKSRLVKYYSIWPEYHPKKTVVSRGPATRLHTRGFQKTSGFNLFIYKAIYNSLGGGFTRILGEEFQFDEHIFQMGWFHHQLVVFVFQVIFLPSTIGFNAIKSPLNPPFGKYVLYFCPTTEQANLR